MKAAANGTPEVVISDAGEILLEARLPYRLWASNETPEPLPNSPMDVSTAPRCAWITDADQMKIRTPR